MNSLLIERLSANLPRTGEASISFEFIREDYDGIGSQIVNLFADILLSMFFSSIDLLEIMLASGLSECRTEVFVVARFFIVRLIQCLVQVDIKLSLPFVEILLCIKHQLLQFDLRNRRRDALEDFENITKF